ncbi:aldehyde dehydrogenase [Paraburkholderia sp. UCT31]|uniref:aldehyde dehydrogenase n=1 Tax=Paraburkholderia sp. UCT31 TaxID=2615209 RepID=UPI0016550972|nr:aldehyde dehydrogenase [Paraburkholderia sp. UCT31]MBC8740359.1 aldehyde dehydrogenase [Paraburkholderia sp. UCT31]
MTQNNYGMWVDGAVYPASGNERIPVTNPYDLQTWGSIAVATEADVKYAVHCAARCFRETWSKVNGYQRGRLLNVLADLLDTHAERLAELETRNNGKLYKETLTQMRFCARSYRYYAGWADKIHGEYLPLDNPDIVDISHHRPYGVVALITPWNSPMALLANKLAPALAAGNCAVVKPSEFASVTTLEFAALISEAGFPAGTVNVLTGDSATGTALIDHPAVRKVSFTGGNVGGQRVMERASRRQIPVTLELGGKSPNIIFADANLPRAINGAIAGIFAAGGQTCIAGSRLLVHECIYQEVVETLTARADQIVLGNPMAPATQMGPVANAPQHERITAIINQTIGSGATLVTRGHSLDAMPTTGYFIAPTVFADVKPDMFIARTEVFGPVLSILKFADEEEAISVANDNPFGLAAGIWTQDVSRAHRVAQRMEAGNVWVNTYRMGAVQAPFGGVKGSGFGKERGIEGLRSYLTVHNLMIDTSTHDDDPFSIRA